MRISIITLLLMTASIAFFFGVRSSSAQDVFASPRATYSPEVEYPAEAKAAGIEGRVVIRVRIDATGKVTDATLVSGHPLLSQNALQAVRSWRYEPTIVGRQAIPVISTVNLTFGTPPPTPVSAPASVGASASPTPFGAVATPSASPLNIVATTDGEKEIGTLKWEIREEATGQILARGDGPVRLKDVGLRDSGQLTARRQTPKTIQLTKEFAIEMAEFPVANVTDKTGFGIAARKTDIQSFSWEWFNIQDSRHAAKLQESGELGIELKQVDSYWEITRTDFTTDVSLRIIRLGTDPPGSPPYWRINISKGSSITWPSVVGGRVVPN
jgi:TonB family protein